MTNINTFYPESRKGWALGLNAGGGNLGVAVIQIVGLLVLGTAGALQPRIVLWVYLPLIVIGGARCRAADGQPGAPRATTPRPCAR